MGDQIQGGMSQRSLRHWILLLAVALAPTCGSAVTIVSFDFPTDVTPTEVDPTVVVTDFSAGSSIVNPGIENGDGQPARSWSGANWTTANDSSIAMASDSYAFFRITPDEGMAMTLSSLTIDVRPHGTGPDAYVVSVVDLASGIETQLGGVLRHSDQTLRFDRKNWETLFGASGDFTNLTGTQEIRIYGFNAKQSGGDVYFDNVQVTGSFSPVPEPASLSLLALSAAFLIYRRR